MTIKILVSSSSNKVPLILALKNAGRDSGIDLEIIAGDMNPASLTFNFADDFWVMPESISANFLEIIKECKRRKINIIMPTRDQDLSFFSLHQEYFRSEDIKLMMPSASAIERCNDKLHFQRFLRAKGFEGESIVVKERFGSGSQNVYLSLSKEQAKSLANSLKAPLYQRMYSGQEISIDTWISRNGERAIASPRRRDFVVNGESKITTTFSNREIEEIAIAVAKVLQVVGISVIQGFLQEDNTLDIIECNPRFGGASTASINSGVPLLELELRELLDLPLDPLISNLVRKSRKQIRADFDYSI